FEQLLMEEDELIDDYLQGMLSRQEKKRFEKIFLVLPERREKLDFARTLRQYTHPPEAGGKPRHNRAWLFDLWALMTMRHAPLGAVAALLVFSVFVTWFVAKAVIVPQDTSREMLAGALAERDALRRQLETQQAEQRRIEQELAQLRAAGQPD